MNQDILLITRALDFAARKHVNQRRKGLAEESYFNHLAEVARLLAEATDGEDANLVVAGLLHDTVPDLARLAGDAKRIPLNRACPHKEKRTYAANSSSTPCANTASSTRWPWCGLRISWGLQRTHASHRTIAASPLHYT